MENKQHSNHEAVSAIGKICQSMTDKKALCDFFLESTAGLAGADAAGLFLAGIEEKIWLETCFGDSSEEFKKLHSQAAQAYQSGKPLHEETLLFIPMIVRSSEIGIACFIRKSGAFSPEDFEIASDMASQVAAALKNIILFEQNLEMERLASIGKSMGMVMHEIKNILQLATFADEWLRMGVKKQNPKHLERGIQGIEKAIREMNGFVYEVLSLTKNYKIKPQKVNLGGLMEEFKLDLSEKAAQVPARLEFDIDPALGEVDAEERSLYRAVLNLVKNALEACDKEDAYVRISAKSVDASHYQIIVADNGAGMSDEVKAKIRQAFFSTKGEKGTGLGVMIVEKTLQAHQGKMEIESELGKGTRFILTLPKIIAVT
ncbi:MAG: GAF domain-containing sensor histidine kinase [Candidatus Omnitrophica bacterium]|nr:GAF domain-containing sensor histidine kinase [Candidatus Omnitrophota bacterium]